MRRLIITDGCMLTILQIKPVDARRVAKSRVIRRVGRIIDAVALDFQTIDRQKQAGGTVQSTTRDASGKIIGTSTTHANSSGPATTQYRDASGRIQATANARTGSGTSGTSTQYRDASGRLIETATTNGTSSTRRDASGRIIDTSTGTGKCPTAARVPVPPAGEKK